MAYGFYGPYERQAVVCFDSTVITFEIGNHTYTWGHHPFNPQKLEISSNKADLIFNNVVATRTMVSVSNNGGNISTTMMSSSSTKGPLTSEQFFKIMQYEAACSPEEWGNHMAEKCNLHYSFIPTGKLLIFQ